MIKLMVFNRSCFQLIALIQLIDAVDCSCNASSTVTHAVTSIIGPNRINSEIKEMTKDRLQEMMVIIFKFHRLNRMIQ